MDLRDIETPCYVCDEGRLTCNLELIASLQRRTGCSVLLALKAFAMFSVFPLMGRYLAGVSASSLNEARLGHEEFANLGQELEVITAGLPQEGLLPLGGNLKSLRKDRFESGFVDHAQPSRLLVMQ